MAHKTVCSRCLGGQTSAPTRATTGKDLTAVLGSHAGAESVIALSLKNARLKCTLHDVTFSFTLNLAAVLPQDRYLRRSVSPVALKRADYR